MNIRRLLFIILFLFAKNSVAQEFPLGDSLKLLKFDTLRIYTEGKTQRFELENSRQFTFCSKIYQLPSNCDTPYTPNCCVFSTNVYEIQNTILQGSVNCFNTQTNGYCLNWLYTQDVSGAKLIFQDMTSQIEKQWISFKKKTVKCYILNKETEAYLYDAVANGNIKISHLFTFGSYNQFNFFIDYISMGKLISTEDIPNSLRGIIRFE